MIMAISTAPQALKNLTATAAARPALEGVDVILGQPGHDPGDRCLVFAFTGTPGEAAIEDTRTVEELTRERDRERYEITCLASSWLGEEAENMDEVMDSAYELMNEVARFVAEDQTLGGAVMRARVSSQALALTQTTKGAVATVRFVVSVDAFSGRP